MVRLTTQYLAIYNNENLHNIIKKLPNVKSPLIGLDLTKQLNLLLIQYKQSSWIQTNKTEGSHKVKLSLRSEWVFSGSTTLKSFSSIFQCDSYKANLILAHIEDVKNPPIRHFIKYFVKIQLSWLISFRFGIWSGHY